MYVYRFIIHTCTASVCILYTHTHIDRYTHIILSEELPTLGFCIHAEHMEILSTLMRGGERRFKHCWREGELFIKELFVTEEKLIFPLGNSNFEHLSDTQNTLMCLKCGENTLFSCQPSNTISQSSISLQSWGRHFSPLLPVTDSPVHGGRACVATRPVGIWGKPLASESETCRLRVPSLPSTLVARF